MNFQHFIYLIPFFLALIRAFQINNHTFEMNNHSLSKNPTAMQFFDDYDVQIKCNPDSFKNNQTLIEEALDQINLRWIDSIVFLVLGSLTFLSTSFIILTFIKYPKMREPPGDIILGISISEFVLTIHWMVSSGYFLTFPYDPPKSNGKFCQANAIFSMSAGSFEFLYNCAFCVYVIWKIKNVLKGGTIHQRYFHIVCWVITIALMIGLGASGDLGKNLFGTCSIKAVSTLPLVGPILFVIYVFLAFATIFYFKKFVPKEERFQKDREEFLNYYYKYVKACAIIWSVLAIANIAAVWNCHNIDGGIAGLNIFLTIGNIAKPFTPLVLSFIRYHDPFLKKRVNRFFSKVKAFFLGKKLQNTIINQQFLDEPKDDKNPNFQGKHLEIQDNQPLPERNPLDSGSMVDEQDIWFNIMKNDMKVMFTYTMISGILLNYKNVRGALEMSLTPEHQDFNSTKRYPITNDTLKLYLPNVMNQINEKSYNTFSTNMIVYAPEVFEDLIQQDQDMIDLEISLDLEKNYDQIQKASGADGGRGGEFFFFSYDNRVILKTLSKDDLKQLRGILKDYYRYFKSHHNSFIAKIYGIYTFERRDIKDQSTSILLMRNIAACPRQYVLRTYDLKGSTFDREVLRKKPDVELNKVTLKDIDFLNLERNIYIEEKFKPLIHEILEQDAEFFKIRKLIDFSLIVFKINKKKYFEDLQNEGVDVNNFFLNKRELFSLKSTAEEGVYYHIGIIDYLQPYNLQKCFEKNWKKLMKVNKDLNTSSQDPDAYFIRFCKFMKEII